MNANMDNRGGIIVKLLALAALAATLVGCSRGSPEMVAVKDARAEYCRCLDDGWPVTGRDMKFVASVRDAVAGVKDKPARVALVRSIAEDLERCGLTLDERGLQVLARRVSAYEAVLEMSMDLLFEEDDDIRMVVDRFFACMSKFREACFSIAQDRRGESESDKSFDARCQCVWSLMEDYAHAMRWWEMSLSRHLGRLSPALKAEYLERRKPFLNYESGRRLRERMMSVVMSPCALRAAVAELRVDRDVPAAEFHDAVLKMCARIREEPEASVRQECVRLLRDRVLAADLVGRTYAGREQMIGNYWRPFTTLGLVMLKSGSSLDEVFSFFIAGWRKYRQMCRSADDSREILAGETEISARRRRDCARCMRGAFENDVRFFERTALRDFFESVPVSHADRERFACLWNDAMNRDYHP